MSGLLFTSTNIKEFHLLFQLCRVGSGGKGGKYEGKGGRNCLDQREDGAELAWRKHCCQSRSVRWL